MQADETQKWVNLKGHFLAGVSLTKEREVVTDKHGKFGQNSVPSVVIPHQGRQHHKIPEWFMSEKISFVPTLDLPAVTHGNAFECLSQQEPSADLRLWDEKTTSEKNNIEHGDSFNRMHNFKF